MDGKLEELHKFLDDCQAERNSQMVYINNLVNLLREAEANFEEQQRIIYETEQSIEKEKERQEAMKAETEIQRTLMSFVSLLSPKFIKIGDLSPIAVNSMSEEMKLHHPSELKDDVASSFNTHDHCERILAFTAWTKMYKKQTWKRLRERKGSRTIRRGGKGRRNRVKVQSACICCGLSLYTKGDYADDWTLHFIGRQLKIKKYNGEYISAHVCSHGITCSPVLDSSYPKFDEKMTPKQRVLHLLTTIQYQRDHTTVLRRILPVLPLQLYYWIMRDDRDMAIVLKKYFSAGDYYDIIVRKTCIHTATIIDSYYSVLANLLFKYQLRLY